MKLRRVALVLAISIVMVAASFTTAFGCTSLFVGKDISANGSRYISRTEDMSDNYCKIFGIREAADHPEGEMFIADNGFQMPYPAHTLKYSYIRDSEGYGETVYDENGNRVGEAYAAAGQNECGVSMTATVTTSQNSNTRKYDPMKRTGIAELSIPSVVLSVATSARHACEYLGSIIDQYGNAEPNSILISDANESWDFETLSGTQWVAIKLDDQRAAMNPNLSLMQGIDITDTENVICSKDLVELPKKDGWLVTDENGLIEVAKTYGSGYQNYNTRIYQGLFFLNQPLAEEMKPATADEPSTVNANNPNPFYMDPTFKLGLMDIIHFEGYRGKGSLEDQDGEHRSRNVRSIGTNNQTECHIFETRPGMPVELATIQWECNQDAEFGIFIPHFTALMTEVDESYDCNITRYANVPKGTSMNWNIAQINNLCNRNRALKVGDAVREYFDLYQQSLINQQAAVDTAMVAALAESKEKATKLANAISKDVTKQVLEMTTGLLEELEAYIAQEDHSEPFVPTAMTKNVMPFYGVPGDNIDELRDAGHKAIQTAVDNLDPFAYLPAQIEEIEALIDKADEDIDAACTEERINAIVANFADEVSVIPTGDEVIADMQAATAAAQAAAEAAQAAADEANAKAEAAQAALTEAQAALTQAQTDLTATQEALAAAQAAQAEDAAAIAELEAALEEAKEAQGADAEAITALQTALTEAQAKQTADEEAITALQNALTEAQNTAAQAAAAADAKAAAAQEAADKAQAAADKAQAELDQAKEAQAAAEAKIAELEQALADQAAAATADKEAAQAALDEAKAAQEADAAAIAALQAEIKQLQINLAKTRTVTNLKLTQKSRKVTVKYTKAPGATAYKIQYKLSTASKWKTLKKSFTKAKATTKALKKGKKYTFRVRAITKIGTKNYYGPWVKKTIKIKK